MIIKLNAMADDKKRWEKSETSDGITKRVSVEQVENGYIVTMEKYGRPSGDGDEDDSKYTNDCKKYISKKNPLEGMAPKTEKESVEDKILDGLENLSF
jgi:hypothetical protein